MSANYILLNCDPVLPFVGFNTHLHNSKLVLSPCIWASRYDPGLPANARPKAFANITLLILYNPTYIPYTKTLGIFRINLLFTIPINHSLYLLWLFSARFHCNKLVYSTYIPLIFIFIAQYCTITDPSITSKAFFI